jgi:hypothetical protein
LSYRRNAVCGAAVPHRASMQEPIGFPEHGGARVVGGPGDYSMLDDRPVLKDRLKAFGVFTGIALGAVSGFELLISGGFDPITPSFGQRAEARPAYVNYIDETGQWASNFQPSAYVTQTSYAPAADTDSLAGGYGDEAAPDGAFINTDEDALYREIERMYAESESAPAEVEAAYQDAMDRYVEEPAYEDAQAMDAEQSAIIAEKESISAYETGIPS